MRKICTKNNKQNGYAILFTIVIVSAISVITAGLTNAAYKQLVLSSLAKDSQSAFYKADTAVDCALYADRKNPGEIITNGGSWSCGGENLTVNLLEGGNYTINPTNDTALTPCLRITVTKVAIPGPLIETTMSARGYNICNLNNIRTVEREIQIKYTE